MPLNYEKSIFAAFPFSIKTRNVLWSRANPSITNPINSLLVQLRKNHKNHTRTSSASKCYSEHTRDAQSNTRTLTKILMSTMFPIPNPRPTTNPKSDQPKKASHIPESSYSSALNLGSGMKACISESTIRA